MCSSSALLQHRQKQDTQVRGGVFEDAGPVRTVLNDRWGQVPKQEQFCFALPQENTARRKHIIETTGFHCKGELRSKLIYKYQGTN